MLVREKRKQVVGTQVYEVESSSQYQAVARCDSSQNRYGVVRLVAVWGHVFESTARASTKGLRVHVPSERLPGSSGVCLEGRRMKEEGSRK